MSLEDYFEGPDEEERDAEQHDEDLNPPAKVPAANASKHPQPYYMKKPKDLFVHQEEMWNNIEAFEHRAWSSRNSGIKTGWADMDAAFEGGLKTGWILVGGDSNIGKCVKFDTEIVDAVTGEIRTVEEIYKSRKANLFTLNQNLKLTETKPSAFVDDGIKPVYRLRTRLGREIETTASHPYLTIDGWKKLMELQVGQHIAVPRAIPVFGNHPMPEHEVKLLAYLLSDGCTIQKAAFTNNNPVSVNEFIEAVIAFDPNLKVNRYDSNETRCPTYQAHHQTRGQENTLLTKVREWKIDKLAIEKAFPREVFMLPMESLSLLLSRMFDCDGTVYETKVDGRSDVLVIGYSSSSKKLIQQVQHLLLRFGIISQIREKQVKYNGGYKQSWELEIRDCENLIAFINYIGFHAKDIKAQEIYAKAMERVKKGANKDIIPKAIWDKVKQIKKESGKTWSDVGKAMGYTGRNAKDIPHNYVKNGRNAQRKTILNFAAGLESPALMDIAMSDVYWDEIVEITYVGMEQVYDLTVDETHNFVANDICVHNTSYLSLWAWNVAHANNDVYVLDFSLDDPMHDKVPRVVAAANKVIINAVGSPRNYTQYPDMLKRRNKGLEMLYNAVDRYKVFDANHSTDIDIIEETIKKTRVYLQEEADETGNDPKRIVVFIDNFHDLTTTAKEASFSDKNKYDYLAQRVSDMATKYDIPVITTGEFKKLNGFRRPTMDDLRESVKIKYEAKAILLCHNEVGIKGEAASIYYDVQGKAAKQPIFEVKFDKNKMGSFKGRLFYEFYPELAFFDPADKNNTKKYNNLIYSN